ncbi:MAG: serine/threonine protein kinase [Deltaproteobacteria bacterium]|nr:MAG: serine/threonine protein kinase [Deltaproteobacteria bacterium]
MKDRYSITERLDQGGMAEVFRGVAESIHGFKKNVAIKRILPSLTKNDKFVAMFLDEAKLSLHLQHANIVQVFDIGIADGSYFLVMEYIDGCNLKHLLERLKQRGKRIAPAHAIYIMIETCKALNYAHHAEGPDGNPLHIVHRDISPPNILLSKNGEVKVVDFGLAKANTQIESTDPGVVKGKFSYLSPEAASGLEVDRRADIFAVGILLWEMFTGRRLFYGDTDYQTVELVRQARVPSIGALNPEIDAELEAIVRKALARDPDQRYQEAADLGDALAQYLFSRRMKVTARDIAALVRDVQAEQQRKRSLAPKHESLIDALIMEEMDKLTSLLEDDDPVADRAQAAPLDPASFVDTSAWASELGLDESGAVDAPPAVIHSAPPRRATPAADAPDPADNEIESLQQMLEPDRTGVHHFDGPGRGVWIALVIAVLLAGGIGAALFLFKDRIF